MKTLIILVIVATQLLVLPQSISAVEQTREDINAANQNSTDNIGIRERTSIQSKKKNGFVEHNNNYSPKHNEKYFQRFKNNEKSKLKDYNNSLEEYLKRLPEFQSRQQLLDKLYPSINPERRNIKDQPFNSQLFSEYTNNSSVNDSVEAVWIREYTSNMMPSQDIGTQIICDSEGNSYVSFSDGTLKYDSNGNQVWQISSGGSLALDSTNNLVIFTNDSIIKYSPLGERIWGIESGWPISALTIDRHNNIFVASGDNEYSAYRLLIYSSSGQYVFYDYHYTDGVDQIYLNKIIVDYFGNVYIAGYIINDVHYDADIVILKWNLLGDFEWEKFYDYPGKTNEYCWDMTIDKQHNVIITGEIEYLSDDPRYQSSCLTIKYAPNGTRKWAKKYNNPNYYGDYGLYISSDPSGNIYVAGIGYGSYDLHGYRYYYLLLKYTPSGTLAWVTRYDSSTIKGSNIAGLFVDKLGNPIVTGTTTETPNNVYEFTTIKYNPSGNIISLSKFSNYPTYTYNEPLSAAIDRNGNVHITGYCINDTVGADVFVIKIANSGNVAWDVYYNGTPWSRDYATGMALDDSGNIYIGGSSGAYAQGTDFLVVKYNPSGIEQWTTRYNSANLWHAYDWLSELAVDRQGNVYVTGSSGWNADTSVTIKYSSQGIQQWIVKYQTGYSSYDPKLLLDNENNVYIGLSSGELIKFNSSGHQLWKTVISPGCGPLDMVYDSSGYIIIMGGCGLVKISSMGEIVWRVPEARFFKIKVDRLGNIYGVRHQRLPGQSQNFYTEKYSPSGMLLWSAIYNSPENISEWYPKIDVDDNGNAYICGYSSTYDVHADIILVKYDSNGSEKWVRRYDRGLNAHEIPSSIHIDSKGNIFILGFSPEGYLMLKYNSIGELKWVDNPQNIKPRGGHDGIIVTDGQNNIYFTGTTYKGFRSSDPYTVLSLVKYSEKNIEVKPNYLSFDNSNIGCQNSQTFTLINHSSIFVNLSNLVCTDSNFTVIPEKHFMFTNDSVKCVVTYRSQILEHHTGKIMISFNNNSWDDSISLSGTSIEYKPIDISSNQVSFDEVYIGCKKRTMIYLENDNNCAMNFSIASDNPNFIINQPFLRLYQNGPQTLEIIFEPLETGYITGNIKIISPHGEEHTIFATGYGVGYQNIQHINLPLSMGWKLISLPVESACPDNWGNVYEYSDGYSRRTMLSTGQGYWKKLTAPNIRFIGNAILSDTVTVNRGWNLIGSISQPLAFSSIATIPDGIISSSLYGYYFGYLLADTIHPGKGYWVKISEPGQLIMNPDNVKTRANKNLESVELHKFNTLTFKNLEGQTSTLYFGIKMSENFSIDYFELPPIPPAGIFDVRFVSQRKLEIIDYDKKGSFPITIVGSENIVYMNWEVKSSDISAVIKIGSEETDISGSGTIKISYPVESVTLNLKGIPALPGEIVMEQNYPNPFNPNTVIKYQLPSASKVMLKIYNMLGQEVETLVNEVQDAGYKSVNFDARQLASGVYYYRITTTDVANPSHNFTQVRKMVLVK